MPREIVESPSLETIKTLLDTILSKLLYLPTSINPPALSNGLYYVISRGSSFNTAVTVFPLACHSSHRLL